MIDLEDLTPEAHDRYQLACETHKITTQDLIQEITARLTQIGMSYTTIAEHLKWRERNIDQEEIYFLLSYHGLLVNFYNTMTMQQINDICSQIARRRRSI